MSVIELLRNLTARRSAIFDYARAHDHFADIEQQHPGTDEAQDAHDRALICLRAYRAELDDPEPRDE